MSDPSPDRDDTDVDEDVEEAVEDLLVPEPPDSPASDTEAEPPG
jgi:hypothetical protein